jgi:hypothetical protein
MLQKTMDDAILALVRYWCFVRHRRICLEAARHVGKRCDPATPISDADKFLWRRIFDHNPLFTTACDKLAAKEYALSVCPDLKSAEVLWVGSDPDQIPPQTLSGNVVVKASCGSGWNVMVHDGKVDRAALREKARRWLGSTYGQRQAEWGYKNGRHRLFVEKMLLEEGQPVRQEYKFHVSGGRTAYVQVKRRTDNHSSHSCRFMRDGQLAPEQVDKAHTEICLPPTFERLVMIAERLTAPFDYMRCDLYELDGEVFFSELTPYPNGGLGRNPYFRNLRNSRWDLRNSWFLTEPQRGWRRTYSAALRRWLDKSALAFDST